MSIEHDDNEAEIQPYPLRLPSRETREALATTWPARREQSYQDASDRQEWADHSRTEGEGVK